MSLTTFSLCSESVSFPLAPGSAPSRWGSLDSRRRGATSNGSAGGTCHLRGTLSLLVTLETGNRVLPCLWSGAGDGAALTPSVLASGIFLRSV